MLSTHYHTENAELYDASLIFFSEFIPISNELFFF